MMLDMSEIDREIQILESKQASLPVIEKLAMLYIVKDHHEPQRKRVSKRSGSEFFTAAISAPLDGLVEILDEHMEAIRLVYPKEYDSVMRRIRELN